MENMEIKDIIQLMEAFSANGLTHFSLKKGDSVLRLKKETEVREIITTSMPAREQTAQLVVSESGTKPAENQEIVSIGSDQVVVSPLVGTFYSSPSPDADVFVKVGDTVKKGQVMGIIEAMKLMNEIESEFDGVVEAILVGNEDVVEYGQPLFRIR